MSSYPGAQGAKIVFTGGIYRPIPITIPENKTMNKFGKKRKRRRKSRKSRKSRRKGQRSRRKTDVLKSISVLKNVF